MVRRTLASFVVIAACGGGSSASDDAGTSTDAPASTSSGAIESSGVASSSSASSSASATTSATSVDTSGDASSSGAQDESSDSASDPCAMLPDPAPDWLVADLMDSVARLSGESELQPGITLSDRASAMRRGQAASWLLERLGELGLEGQGHGYGSGTNVWARLPATTASEGTLVLGAHYDGVPNSPAAADNGTGTAAVLAAARQLQEVQCRRYDVIFVLFDQEESGLVGSSAYAGKLITDDEPVVAVHSIDMISFDGDGDGVIEVDQPDAGIFALYEAAAMELGVDVVETDSVATDYQSFQQAGIPACGLMEEWNNGDHTPYWHTPMDSYAQIDFEYLATGSALVHQTFARLLNPDAI